jgi:glucuronate isomerase
MKTFINDDFMLHNPTATILYHNYAEQMPIFDYHCHLNPQDILENRQFGDLAELWLAGDHYKWRLMRASGIDEKYITGDADNYQKFLKWAQTVPKCIGNPIYHWTHLELKRYFGVDELLSPESAPAIWQTCNEKLTQKDFYTRGLIERFHVKIICTTDDPTDSLSAHKALYEDKTFDVKVLPTFRPDKALHIENDGFMEWIAKLAETSNTTIDSFGALKAALEKRANYFKSIGCKVADQSFGSPDFSFGTEYEAEAAFEKALYGKSLTSRETGVYQRQLMLFLGRLYNKYGFVMQLHFGVIRNTNSRMFRSKGPDTGFDSIGTGTSADSLAALFDSLEITGELPKTVVYSLDENDNAKIASVIGCFQNGDCAGKIQLGAAWWYNDHRDGMLSQMKTLGNIGLLGSFIGMLTDSRSFLSYTRHEYFRRILSNLIGTWAENGEILLDVDFLGSMIKDICYNNAVRYFGIAD